MVSVRPRRSAGDEAAGLVGEVEQDRAGFEQRNRRAAVGRRLVDDGRDAVVGRDLEEVGGELFALADVDRHDAMGQPVSSRNSVILWPLGVVQ
jgi:hypothetical protein